MVTGLKSFQKWFQGYEQQYTIIGGTAYSVAWSEFKNQRNIRDI